MFLEYINHLFIKAISVISHVIFALLLLINFFSFENSIRVCCFFSFAFFCCVNESSTGLFYYYCRFIQRTTKLNSNWKLSDETLSIHRKKLKKKQEKQRWETMKETWWLALVRKYFWISPKCFFFIRTKASLAEKSLHRNIQDKVCWFWLFLVFFLFIIKRLKRTNNFFSSRGFTLRCTFVEYVCGMWL